MTTMWQHQPLRWCNDDDDDCNDDYNSDNDELHNDDNIHIDCCKGDNDDDGDRKDHKDDNDDDNYNNGDDYDIDDDDDKICNNDNDDKNGNVTNLSPEKTDLKQPTFFKASLACTAVPLGPRPAVSHGLLTLVLLRFKTCRCCISKRVNAVFLNV